MKIKKIEVQNFKAISNLTANFDGCSAIITAGNNKGKTSLLRGLIDRLRGEKPELILKQGEKNGVNIIELTDGSKIEWSFTEKSEKISYITKDGIKQTTGVISQIGEKYFGRKFDIDKFLNSTPKAQIAELQKIVGLDFTEIDNRYKIAYDLRTEKNRKLNELRAENKKEPEKKEFRSIDEIKKEIAKIKAENQKSLEIWENENEKLRNEINIWNSEQRDLESTLNLAISRNAKLKEFKGTDFEIFIDYKGATLFVDKIKKPESQKTFIPIPKPELKNYDLLENELENAQRYYATYELELKQYNDWLELGKKAKEEAEEADKKVKEIEAEKRKMIESANMPKEFQITENEILYNGLPLQNNQISSSGKYIAALKLGALVLGEIRTLHFDASFLDKNSLNEVMEWANSQNLQLLIERPDFDGGEIKYEIIES